MKDIVITGNTFRRELLVLAGCFGFAVLFDLFSIIKYHRPFVELFQTIGYIITITVVIYLILAVLRLIVWGVKVLVKKVSTK